MDWNSKNEEWFNKLVSDQPKVRHKKKTILTSVSGNKVDTRRQRGKPPTACGICDKHISATLSELMFVLPTEEIEVSYYLL